MVLVRPSKRREPEVFHLWPENVPAWDLWQQLQTQWRIGVNGPEGLHYPGVESELRNGACRVRPKDLRQRWQEIKVMEGAALRVWARKARKPGS